MLCLKTMALGDSIDVQREKRWPGQTSSSDPKICWDPYQVDDVSDTEGLLGRPDDDGEFPSD